MRHFLPNNHSILERNCAGLQRAFTLIEMLVAVTVLMMMSMFLVSISSQAGKVWSRGESQNQSRQKVRAALDYIGQELRQAALPVDSNKIAYQLQVTPSSLDSSYKCPDAIFWVAPIATNSTQGDLAEIGYFVQWDTSTHRANLCRLLVNPGDANYLLYTSPSAWVSTSLLQTLAPANKSGSYQGLFLENVLGMWVKALKIDGSDYEGDPHTSKKLPAYVEISIVGIDSNTAKRIAGNGQYSSVQDLYDATDSATFVASLPTSIKNAATTTKLRVSLDNYK
jgi:hypothetical protein